MDNDVSTYTTSTNRQGRQWRRIIAGGVAAVILFAAGVAVGTLQHSKAGTSGALGAWECPTMIPGARTIPSITPAPDVDWHGCDLTGLSGYDAHLWGADLTGATLTGAYLYLADLTGATLTGADLTGADLRGADLRFVTLTSATLTGADLTGADLTGADLPSVIYSNTTCPNGSNSKTRNPQSCAS